MRASELRIGNYIRFSNNITEGEDICVNARFFSSLAGGRPSSELKLDEEINAYYSGIPITEDRLKRFGFDITEYSGQYRGFKENVEILIQEYICVYKRSLTTYTQIKYVHQLQNLYFALTGEELYATI